jgi:hypothetical protein
MTVVRRRVQLISEIVFGLAVLLWGVSLWLPFVGEWLSEKSVFGLILVGLIVQVIALLDELTRGPGIESAIGHDQDADLDRLRKYVRERRPESADLIEYSSFMVNSLLEDLRRQQTKIRLLICDPTTAVNAWQAQRIRTCISTLRDVTLKDYAGATVRCYQLPASVRGRKIDGYLNIGWYFYGHDLYGVQGTNTMITIRTDAADGRLLRELFEETFELLWNHPRTRELDLAGGSPG